MENQFTLSCCSTVDLPYAYMASRHIPVLFYTYVVDGTQYEDDMGRDPAALPRFYGFIRQGASCRRPVRSTWPPTWISSRNCCKPATCCTSPSPPASPGRCITPSWLPRSCGKSIPTVSWWSSTLCAPPPATACWWTAPPTCGTRESPWTTWPSGCWTTGTRCITSSSPAI